MKSRLYRKGSPEFEAAFIKEHGRRPSRKLISTLALEEDAHRLAANRAWHERREAQRWDEAHWEALERAEPEALEP